jgi:hypothetical protein
MCGQFANSISDKVKEKMNATVTACAVGHGRGGSEVVGFNHAG